MPERNKSGSREGLLLVAGIRITSCSLVHEGAWGLKSLFHRPSLNPSNPSLPRLHWRSGCAGSPESLRAALEHYKDKSSYLVAGREEDLFACKHLPCGIIDLDLNSGGLSPHVDDSNTGIEYARHLRVEEMAHLVYAYSHADTGSKYPPAEPEALRLLAPQRGLIATEKTNPTSWRESALCATTAKIGVKHTPGIVKLCESPGKAGGLPD